LAAIAIVVTIQNADVCRCSYGYTPGVFREKKYNELAGLPLPDLGLVALWKPPNWYVASVGLPWYIPSSLCGMHNS